MYYHVSSDHKTFTFLSNEFEKIITHKCVRRQDNGLLIKINNTIKTQLSAKLNNVLQFNTAGIFMA